LLIPKIPATWEVEIIRLSSRSAPGKSWQDPISKIKLGVVVHICHPGYLGDIDRRNSVWAKT
jgi:hypothetical protein